MKMKLIKLFIYICVLLTLSLPIQKLLKACDADASHVLHLCFDNITEYDPDLVFDKNVIFMKHAYIQVLIKNKNNAWIFSRKSYLYCILRYSYNKIFWGPWKFD